MRDDVAEHPAAEAILHPAEADRRKAILRRLRAELAGHGIESVLAGRHVLRLNTAEPWSRSGPADPELHVQSEGCRCRVTTDGERYLFSDGTLHAADDPAGAAGHIIAIGGRGNPGPDRSAPVADDDSAAPQRIAGPGEQALRQLIDDGII